MAIKSINFKTFESGASNSIWPIYVYIKQVLINVRSIVTDKDNSSFLKVSNLLYGTAKHKVLNYILFLTEFFFDKKVMS